MKNHRSTSLSCLFLRDLASEPRQEKNRNLLIQMEAAEQTEPRMSTFNDRMNASVVCSARVSNKQECQPLS